MTPPKGGYPRCASPIKLTGDHINGLAPQKRPRPGTEGESFDAIKTLLGHRAHNTFLHDWLLFVMRDLRHLDTAAAGDLADWIVYLELEGKAERTLYTYARLVASLLREYPDKQIGEFSADDIKQILAATPRRSRHISRSILNKFFEWAETEGRVERTPMTRVPKIKHPDKFKGDTFTLAEVALLEALPESDGQLFAILFGTGLRKSEARCLRRGHIDLERRRLTVVNGKGGKTRVVAMTPSALAAVGDLDLFERLSPQDHLWATKPGGGAIVRRRDPVAHTTFSRWYTRCLTQAGVRYLRPHTTRHTYHELLRLAGLNLEERQALMGHVSIRTTADIYGHLDFDQVADKLSTFRIEDV